MTETSTYHRAGRRAALAAGAACIWLLAAAPSAVAQAEDAAEDSLFVTMLLPLSLALIMVSLGLSLTPADFRRILQFPRGVGIGLVNLLVVSPLLAFAVAALFGLEAALAVGLVLLGASPGGTTANLLTHLARGDTALSVTMTAISSVAATVTIPLYLGLAIDVFDADFANDPEIIGVATRVFFITVVPLSIGMWIRSRWTSWAVDVEDRAKRIALALFVLVVGGTIVNESDAITDSFAELALATLTLNLAAMTISFNVARLARLSRRQATAIAMELGVHNGTVAITVGAGIATILASPAAVYSVFMFVTAGVFARLMYKRNAGEPLAAAAAIPEPGPVEPPTRRTESGPPLGPPVAAPAPTGSRRNAVTPGGVVWAALWGVAVLLVVAAVVITAIGIT
ncbi:MAG TPA: bile acid:sodium symporter family protein [Thermoleophilaceae bacterium]|nr:bile acid:sodium symporter family protein [Thermoleophilaceae bacterium]